MAGSFGGEFDSFHESISVGLIATPRDRLLACRPEDAVSHVKKRNEASSFSFVPVFETRDGQNRVLGLMDMRRLSAIDEGIKVNDCYIRISEEMLVGSDCSILSFILDAHSNPCRLVVSGGRIAGLVRPSDLQKLPARAALFSVITNLEITMADAIAKLSKDNEWINHLSDGRRTILLRQLVTSNGSGAKALLFTQISDKFDILKKMVDFTPWSKGEIDRRAKAIRKLRDSLFHANDYAVRATEAEDVCKTVRELLEIKAYLRDAVLQ